MKITKRYGLIIGFIAVLSLFLPLNSLTSPNAYASSNIILSDSATCTSIGGTWIDINQRCDVNTLSLSTGDTLTIPGGITLNILGSTTVPVGALIDIANALSITGSLINNGAIIIESGAFLANPGTITNNGSISIADGGLLTTGNSFTNTGSIIVTGQGQIDNAAGTFTNTASGVITTSPGLSFLIETGSLSNAGQINNNGQMYNISAISTNSGTINNINAELTNDLTFTNTGTILSCPGTIDGLAPITTGTIVTTCTQNPSTVSMTLSSSTVSLPGGSVGVTVSVTGSGPTPTGVVIFSDSTGTFTPASCTLNSSGQCNVTYVPAVLGPVTLVATYSGDQSNSVSSANQPLSVISSTATISSTALTLAPSTVTLGGGSTTVSVQVTGTSPSGTVTFSAPSGTFNAASCTLNSSGQCNVTYTPTTTGSVVITANYGGDASNSASSGTGTLAVNPAPVVTHTTTALTLAPSTIPLTGNSVISVKVTGTSPSGTVTFSAPSGTFNAASCTLNSSGQCNVTYTPTTTGSVVITAKYGGDVKNSASSGTGTLKITACVKSTTTDVKLAPSTIKLGKSTTVQVRITGISPSGTVTFSAPSGTFNAASCKLHSGQCHVKYTPTTTGSVVITANYGGDLKNTANGGSATLTVQSAPVKTCDDKNGHHDNDGDHSYYNNKDHDENGDCHSDDYNDHGDDDHNHK